MDKIKLGIIGFGNIGNQHTGDILKGNCPKVDLVAICDRKEERRKAAEEKVPGVKTFEKAEDMLDSGLINACLICVPHYDHPTYAIACLERGIHVLVEKPAGVYTKQVLEMNAVADQHPEVVYGMMFNQRTNCIYRKMHDLVHSGKYGQIRRTNWLITNWYRPQAYYDSGDWRATWSGEGGGVLLNQCPHQLDMWQWICGMPVKVDAKLHYGKWHDIEVEDDVTAYVEYANGATGVFITTTCDACGSNRFEIQMDKAKLVAENNELKIIEFEMTEQEFSKTNSAPFASPKTTVIDPQLDGENSQHKGVINAWADAILLGTPLIADGREGINGLTLSNAMHLSSFLEKPVDIPFDHELYYKELMKRVKTSRRKTTVSSGTVVDLSDTFTGTK